MTQQNLKSAPSADVSGGENQGAAESKVLPPLSDNSSATPPAAVNNPQKKPKNKPKNKPALTLEEFIKYAYSRNGQRLKLTVQDASRISTSIREGDLNMDGLQPCVDSDTALRVPLELLMVADTVTDIPRARDAIRKYVLAVMLQNPLFKGDDISPALRSEPSVASIKQALLVMSPSRSAAVADTKINAAPETKADAITRANAYRLLFTWFATSKFVTLDDLAALLFETLWEPIMVSRKKARTDWVRALVETEDVEALGWVFASAREKINDARRAQSAASQQAATAIHALEELTREHSQLDEECARLVTENSEIREELKVRIADFTRREREGDLRHRSELQTLTGRLIALLESNAAMLHVGITAASRSEGNLQVLLERAESVAAALREELTGLRSRNIDAPN